MYNMSSMRKFTSSEIVKVVLSEKRAATFAREYIQSDDSMDEESENLKNIVFEEGPLHLLNGLFERRSFLTKESHRELAKFWRKQGGEWERFRPRAWLLLSGAHGESARHSGYYAELDRSFQSSLPATQKLIRMDIRRTSSPQMTDEKRETMFRILFNIAKRRMDMGYCQGMNFICVFFLDCGLSEEEVFWVMVYLFEEVTHPTYYTSMAPALGDVQLFRYLIRWADPGLTALIIRNLVDLNMLLLPLFVTLFSTLKSMELKRVAMDQVFFEGMLGLFKLVLVFFELFRTELLKTRDTLEFKRVFEDSLGRLSNFLLLKKKLQERYINRPVFAKLRKLVLAREMLKFGDTPPARKKQPKCAPGFPVCFAAEGTGDKMAPPVYATENVLENLVIRYMPEGDAKVGEMRFVAMPELGSFMAGQLDKGRIEWMVGQSRAEAAGQKGHRGSGMWGTGISASGGSGLRGGKEGSKGEIGMGVSLTEALGSSEPVVKGGERNLLLFRESHRCALRTISEKDRTRMYDLKQAFFRESWKTDHDFIRVNRKVFQSGYRSKGLGGLGAVGGTCVIRSGRRRGSGRSRSEDLRPSEELLVQTRRVPAEGLAAEVGWTFDEADDGFLNQRIPEGMEELLFQSESTPLGESYMFE